MLEKLADIGVREASVRFTTAMYDGVNDSHVTLKPVDNGYAILAEGNAVAFIEFGAGDATGIMAGQYDEVPSVVRPGSWSESHAQMYSRYGFWVFAGQILHEVEPVSQSINTLGTPAKH